VLFYSSDEDFTLDGDPAACPPESIEGGGLTSLRLLDADALISILTSL
jgi:hypothetical protein